MRIAVFGLGYVGAVSAACFSSEGHDVIGVDIAKEKVDIINSGKSPIVEPGLEEKILGSRKTEKLTATTDYQKAIKNSDISLACVGTPSQSNGGVTLDYIYRVAEQVGEALKKNSHYHVFVIRSTVPPGTLKECLDIIEKVSGKKLGKDFGGCSNPEFLREGSALKDFYNPPHTIVGEIDKKSGDMLEEVYKTINAPFIRTEVGVAEMIKYANNVFHALKVVFGNEIGTVCKQYNVDSHKLMEIFCRDTKLNISPNYLMPGFAFGGSCLPKDVRGLSYLAKVNNLDLPLVNSLMASNKIHIQRAVDMILSRGKKKIGVLGISFKGNTDDLRESPMVDVVEALLGKGYDVRIYDRNVHLAKLFGANKEYINNKIPHISNLIVENIGDILEHSELLIIGNQNKEFEDTLKHLDDRHAVIDLVRILKNTDSVKSNYDGICW